jgi:hypothetical protein
MGHSPRLLLFRQSTTLSLSLSLLLLWESLLFFNSYIFIFDTFLSFLKIIKWKKNLVCLSLLGKLSTVVWELGVVL